MNLVLLLAIFLALCANGQEDSKDSSINYKTLENPFRSQKVNLLWDKARTKLTENKLKHLYVELKTHDKEVMALKKLKADDMDKEGLRESEVRKRFNGIMFSYGLAKPSDKQNEGLNHRALFKDKKLERLWQKANKVGLKEEELLLLKNEFQHHQEKLDQFHQLKEFEVKSQDGNLKSNSIHLLDDEDKETFDFNTLDGKAKALKEDYHRLHRLATNANPTEFVEPKVRGLWKLAQEADFNDEELESLRQELHHYEQRMVKLHHLKADFETDERLEEKKNRKLAKHADSVDKLHAELAAKIAARHSEL